MILLGGLQRNPFRFQITPVATLVNYYFNLADAPAAFWTHVRSDGGDVRVVKQDWTPVPREIVGFDAGAKVGSLWIKGDSATSFWITYGNAAWTEPAAGATYGKSATWESALKLVLHGQNFADSTSNTQSVSHSVGVTAANPGKMSGSFVDSAPQDNIAVAHNDSLVFTDLAMVMWIHINGAVARIVNKTSNNNGLQLYNNNPILQVGATSPSLTATNAIPTGSWHHIGFSTDSLGNSVQYLDGSPNGSGSTGTPSSLPAVELAFLNRNAGDRGAYGDRVTYANLEEIRVYNRVVSGTEFANMYANQNAPATFWTIGFESQA